MREVLLIGCGGFLGAVLRYGLAGWVQSANTGSFPWGTLAVNVLGCFAIGLVVQFAEIRGILDPSVKAFLLIGVLGAFTTFSTFSHESVTLLLEGDGRLAALNIVTTPALCLGAVLLARTATLRAFG